VFDVSQFVHVSLNTESQDGFKGIENDVRNSWEGWDVSTNRQADELSQSSVELLTHNCIVDFKNGGVENLSVVVDDVGLDLIEEWDHFELL